MIGFLLKVSKPGVGEWDVAAVFNWSRAWTKTGLLSAASLGIPSCERGFIFYDVWQEQVLGMGVDEIALSLPPMTCRVVSIRPCEDHPQVIATSRHLTQGADDLLEARWDPVAQSLSGRSQVVGGDPYRLRYTVPEGWEVEEGVGRMVLKVDKNAEVEWMIDFAKEADGSWNLHKGGWLNSIQ